MNSICYKASLHKSKNRVKSFIARLFGLCLLFSGSVASGSDDSATISAIHTDTTAIKLDVSDIRAFLDYSNGSFMLNRTNSKLDDIITRTGDTRTKLQSVLDFLTYNTGAGSNDNLKYYLQQILAEQKRAGDLAGNAWWRTNSAFALVNAAYSSVYPDESPNSANTYSFPQFLSKWSGMLSMPYTTIGTTYSPSSLRSSGDWWDWFGTHRVPARGTFSASQPFTWFDWVSEAMRSNMTVRLNGDFSPSYVSLESEVAAHDTQPTNLPTSTPLPQYSLPDDPGFDAAEGVLEDAQSTVEDVLDTIPKPRTGGSSEIVVIPEFTVGGIHVREYRANLSTSIVPVCRSVCSFLYGVSLFAFLFSFAKGEYSYYASLGRHWGKYH